MEKRITLNKLISYVLSLKVESNGEETTGPVNGVFKGSAYDDKKETADHDNPKSLKTLKNRLTHSTYKSLKYPEDDVKTVGDLPKRLRKMFEPFISQTKRHPVLASKYSLLHSVLYLTQDLDKLSKDDDVEEVVKEFNKLLINDIYTKDIFKKFNYKALGWTKKETVNTVKEYRNNLVTLRLLADYFNVNIFLLNINEDKIYTVYPEESLNMFKPNIFMAYHDETFEPLTYEDNKLWMYHHKPIKKIINVDKQYISVLHADFSKEAKDKDPKLFQVEPENLDKYLEDDIKDDKDDKDDQDDDDTDGNGFDEVYPGDQSVDVEECTETDADVDDLDLVDIEDIEADDSEKVTNSKAVFCKKKHNTSAVEDTTEATSKTDVAKKKKKKTKLKDPVILDTPKKRNKKTKSEDYINSATSKKAVLKQLHNLSADILKGMKLQELQNLALDRKLTIRHEASTKTNNRKLKTKAELTAELLAN